MTTDSSTLDWPDGFQRTPPADRIPYPHNFRVDVQQAFENILDELLHRDVTSRYIESAAKHQSTRSNIPYKGADPDDPGVVAYYTKHGSKYAVPCDRWTDIRDNAQAIARYLNAKRSIERYGVETVQDRSEMDTQIYNPE